MMRICKLSRCRVARPSFAHRSGRRTTGSSPPHGRCQRRRSRGGAGRMADRVSKCGGWLVAAVGGFAFGERFLLGDGKDLVPIGERFTGLWSGPMSSTRNSNRGMVFSGPLSSIFFWPARTYCGLKGRKPRRLGQPGQIRPPQCDAFLRWTSLSPPDSAHQTSRRSRVQ